MNKICSKCHILKPTEQFRKLSHLNSDQLDTYCILCRNVYMKNYNKTRRNNDINFKILYNMRINLRSALKQNAKIGKPLDYLGCSLDQFKEYIEKQFESGMTWENYGKNGWEFDHIKPISTFDLSNEIELRLACNYKNLQPLWGFDNRKKSNK